MIRKLLCMASLLLVAAFAQAGEAGRIVFVAGQVNIANHGVNQGDVVHEGDEITTGSDGYVYLKTIDNGFLILRPSSRARIIHYHVDRLAPKNTRIKLELLNGVARSISGEAVKEARQNFRFNTPVAAIGVRGTDFTVFTDADTSRVAVISGGIVVASFAGSCGPEGSGPCEGKGSHELFANQVGHMLQVRRGQAAPQLLPTNTVAPDALSPVRADEPGKAASPLNDHTASDVSLDAQKDANLLRQNQNTTPSKPIELPTVPPLVDPVEVPVVSPPVVVPEVPVATKEIMWGRFSELLGTKPSVDIATLQKNGTSIHISNHYALYLGKTGVNWVMPERGSVAFALKSDSEAVVTDQKTRVVTPATMSNGQLQVDFDKKTFATSFVLAVGQENFAMTSRGIVSDNKLYGDYAFNDPKNINMDVTGIVGPQSTGSAVYLFQRLLDERRLATGVAVWGK